MAGEFFSKEMFVGGIGGGGVLYSGAEGFNALTGGALGLQNGWRLAYNSLLKIGEGALFAAAEEKFKNPYVKEAFHSAKYTAPATVVYDMINAGMQRQTGSSLSDYAYSKGVAARTAIVTRIRPTATGAKKAK